MQSWGYILQRANVLGLNLIQELSRVPCQTEGKEWNEVDDNNGLSGLNVTGRIVLDVWRLFRSEVCCLHALTLSLFTILIFQCQFFSFTSAFRLLCKATHLKISCTISFINESVIILLKVCLVGGKIQQIYSAG